MTRDREIEASAAAFFFDFDGVLAPIVDDPEGVKVERGVLEALDRLHAGCGGALAIVSGRPIEAVDRFLAPLKLPASGVHGLQMRGSDGHIRTAEFDGSVLGELRRRVDAFVAGHDGLTAEPKPGAVALHYRRRPETENEVLRFARTLAGTHEGVSLMEGKMVAEFRLGGRTKGDSVAGFMATQPFTGRHPVFVGDDVTDEDGFRAVAELGGFGIKIGDGDTVASLRFADINRFHDWLVATANAAGAGIPMTMTGDGILKVADRTVRSSTETAHRAILANTGAVGT